MKELISQRITCPHCGQPITINLDTSMGDQDFIEDCTACCHPIHLNMHLDRVNKKLALHVDSDNEQIF